MINNKIKLIFFILFALLYGCKDKTSFSFPDISENINNIEVLRTEKMFFESENIKPLNTIESLMNEHPNIKDLYITQLLQLDRKGQNLEKNAKMFFENPSINALYDSIKPLEKQIDIELNRVKDAFKYYQYYFPNNNIPEIFTAVTEFAPSAFTLDTLAIGISLEMYLGKDFVYYPSLEFPQYLSDHFELDHLPINTMYAWFNNKFPLEKDNPNLLDQMIQNGKVLYLLDLTLPNTLDYQKMSYYPINIEWCKANEREIWSFFIEKDLLYETNKLKYGKYVNAGPTSSGMPPESPGNVGTWVGWQIVRKFMSSNKNFTLQDLVEIENGQVVLQKSKYKP